MALTITTEALDDVTVACTTGRLDGNGAPIVDSECSALIEAGKTKLVLDLGGLEYISSAGLRSILVIAKKMKTAQGALAMCCLPPMVAEVVKMSGFDKLLTVTETRDKAVAAVRA